MVSTAASQTTRDVILDAVDSLMARYGFRKMTVDDVAREAGLGRRTIYLHFAGKEDLGLSSIGRVVQRVHDRLEELAGDRSPAPDRLRAMLYGRVLGRLESIRDYAHSLDELFEVVRPAYMARRRDYFEFEQALIAGVLEDGVREGSLALEGSPKAVAEALLLATNAFLPYSLSVRELGEPGEVRERLKTMVEVLLSGLAARTPRQGEK